MRKTTFYLLMVLAVLALGACSKKEAPPAAALAPVKVKPKPPAAKTPDQGEKAREQAAVFGYNPEGVRDPFVSLLNAKKANVDIPIEELPPLQRVPVTDMTLEGIILMGKKSVAHVITPDGKAHIVTLGTGMGRNNGRVIRILSDSIVINEEFENYLGKKFTQETVLKLRQKEGETL